MQRLENCFGQFSANARHRCELIDSCIPNALQAAEMHQQGFSPLWADAFDRIKLRPLARFTASCAVPKNSETVRFITDFLDQMKRRMLG